MWVRRFIPDISILHRMGLADYRWDWTIHFDHWYFPNVGRRLGMVCRNISRNPESVHWIHRTSRCLQLSLRDLRLGWNRAGSWSRYFATIRDSSVLPIPRRSQVVLLRTILRLRLRMVVVIPFFF